MKAEEAPYSLRTGLLYFRLSFGYDIERMERRQAALIALMIGMILLLESFFLIFKGSKEKRQFLRTAGMVSVPIAILLVWIGLAQMA